MKIIKLAVALFVTAWVSSANATLIYDFSWSDGGVEVSGQISGLMDGIVGIQHASSIITYGRGEYRMGRQSTQHSLRK
jgi:hypothetical protein